MTTHSEASGRWAKAAATIGGCVLAIGFTASVGQAQQTAQYGQGLIPPGVPVPIVVTLPPAAAATAAPPAVVAGVAITAPPTTLARVTATAAPAQPAPEADVEGIEVSFTGIDATPMLISGLALVAVGGGFVVMARRRRSAPR